MSIDNLKSPLSEPVATHFRIASWSPGVLGDLTKKRIRWRLFILAIGAGAGP